MAIANGIFSKAKNTFTPKVFGIEAGKGVSAPIQGPVIGMNADFTENFMHKATNNSATEALRSMGRISDSPAGARTHGGIREEYGAVHKNLAEAGSLTKNNISSLKEQLSVAPDSATRTLLQRQLGSANAQAVGIGMRRGAAAIQEVGAHTVRTGKYALGEGSFRERAIKTTAIGGTWMGGNTLLRGVSGGGLTYNNDGERDIAGIPFL